MNHLREPQPWSPLTTFPYLVWQKIFKNLDLECYVSIRNLTSELDCCIPAIYNPTPHLDEVMPLLSAYLTRQELFSFRQVNSFWLQCANTILDSQCSNWRGEINMRKQSTYIKFSSAAGFRTFYDTFGLVNTDPVIHRQVVLKFPNVLLDLDEFIDAAEDYMDKYGAHIWHLRIESDLVNDNEERQLQRALYNVAFTMTCLKKVQNLKTFYWSTKFVERLELQQIVGIFGLIPVPTMAHLEKFTLSPFRPYLWSILATAFYDSLKVLVVNCHHKWLAVSHVSFPEVTHLQVDVTPADASRLAWFAESNTWRLSTFQITLSTGSLESESNLKDMIRESHNTLKVLSIDLKKSSGFSFRNSSSSFHKGELYRLQQDLQLPNLKRLKLTNFLEDSFDCLPKFAPKLESLTLVNCVLMNEATEIFTGNWKTVCCNSVKITAQAWGVLKFLKKVTVTINADLTIGSYIYKEELKRSQVFQRPNDNV